MAISELEKKRKLNEINKFLSPDSGYNLFGGSERTTQKDFDTIRGVLDNASEYGIDENIQASLFGSGNILNDKLNAYNAGDTDYFGEDFLRSYNQSILGGIGSVPDWFIDSGNKIQRDLNKYAGTNFEVYDEDKNPSNISGKLQDLAFDYAGIGYGDIDKRALPSNFSARAGGAAATVTPYMFGLNAAIARGGSPIQSLNAPVAPSGVFSSTARPEAVRQLTQPLRSYMATSPITATAAELAGTVGYSLGVPYMEDTLADPNAGTAEKIFASVFPLITTGGAGVGPELTKATGRFAAGTVKNLVSSGGPAVNLANRTFQGLKGIFNKEGFIKGFKDAGNEAALTSPKNIENAYQKASTDLVSYLGRTKDSIELFLKSNPKFMKTFGITAEQVGVFKEEAAAKMLIQAMRESGENPVEIGKRVNAFNKRFYNSKKPEEQADMIGSLAAIATQQGDDVASQSPVVLAMTNWESKNNESFLKRFSDMQRTREGNLNTRIKEILQGSDAEYTGMTYADALSQASKEESERITGFTTKHITDHFNSLQKNFNLTNDEAATRTTQLIRELFSDVKVQEKALWNETKNNFDAETFAPFKSLEESVITLKSENPSDTFYNTSLKKPIETILKKLKDGKPVTYKEAYNLKKDIDLKITSELAVPPNLKDQNKIVELFNLRKVVNDDIGNGFDFAKTASAQTRSKHDLFTRKNAVYDIVAQTNRSTAKMEESTLTEVLLEGGVAKYEGTPYALNEVQDVIKKSVKLTNKDTEKQKEIIQKSNDNIQFMLGTMVDDIFDSSTGAFAPERIVNWINSNQKTINKFPKFEEFINTYRNNIGALKADLDNNVFNLNTLEKDPFTNKLKLIARPKSENVNYFQQIINSDNPSVVLEKVLLDEEFGPSQLINIYNNTKAVANQLKSDKSYGPVNKAVDGFKTELVEAISRIGYSQNKVPDGDGNLTNNFSNILNRRYGQSETLSKALQDLGIFTKKELQNLDNVLNLYNKDLGALENPELFRALKDVDSTNGMIDTFVRVAAANISTFFSAGTGAGLVIAGRFSRIGQSMLRNLKNEDIKLVIEDALLDSIKFEKLLKIGNELSKSPSEILSPSNIASAYTKMRTFLLPYGVKLSYRDFESEWTNMIKEERIEQGLRDTAKLTALP